MVRRETWVENLFGQIFIFNITPAHLLCTLPLYTPTSSLLPTTCRARWKQGAPDAYVFVPSHVFKPTFASSRGSVVSPSECGG